MASANPAPSQTLEIGNTITAENSTQHFLRLALLGPDGTAWQGRQGLGSAAADGAKRPLPPARPASTQANPTGSLRLHRISLLFDVEIATTRPLARPVRNPKSRAQIQRFRL